MIEFKVNNFITLKLENKKTIIYVKENKFLQCKQLVLEIPKENISIYDDINSIDEASEIYSINFLRGATRSIRNTRITLAPEEEFWGHCSNLQMWAENDYDTRFLHRNLAFPLLRKLADLGDSLASIKFKEEIIYRASRGTAGIIEYLMENFFLYLKKDDINLLFLECLLNENREAIIYFLYIKDFILYRPKEEIRDLLDEVTLYSKKIDKKSINEFIEEWVHKIRNYLEYGKVSFFDLGKNRFDITLKEIDHNLNELIEQIHLNLVKAARNHNDLVIIVKKTINIYTQFEFHSQFIHWEVVSNKFLKGEECLSEEQISQLRKMAFQDPSHSYPNFHKNVNVGLDTIPLDSKFYRKITDDVFNIFINVFSTDLDDGFEFRHCESD